jgi:ankyrin repeat protein
MVEYTPEEIKTFEALLAKHYLGMTYTEFRAQQFPHQSSNPIGEVLVGENVAEPLIEAASAGDLSKLQSMLEDSSWVEIALRRQHYVYREMRPAENKDDVRAVATEECRGVVKAVLAAAKNGHAEVVSFLFDVGTRHDVYALSRPAIIAAVENNYVNVVEALDKADPSYMYGHLDFKHTPIDLAIKHKNLEMVKRMLELMDGHSRYRDDYRKVRLRHAARCGTVPILQLLLDNGYPIAGTGALHGAAERNAIERMRFLIEQGADIDELCPEKSLHDPTLCGSRSPMHFAARSGQQEAMELLETLGAKTDVKDINGKTPRDLLEEWKEERKAWEGKRDEKEKRQEQLQQQELQQQQEQQSF